MLGLFTRLSFCCSHKNIVPPVTIRIPSPTCARTVPRPKDSTEPLDSITLYPQPQETIQDIKLLINDWVGAYWLGPYSLQLPFVKGEDGRGKIYSKKKDFSEVRAGEKLNEWLEVQDAFEHLQEGEERVLEAVRGVFSVLLSVSTVLTFEQNLTESSALVSLLFDFSSSSLLPALLPTRPPTLSVFKLVRPSSSRSVTV